MNFLVRRVAGMSKGALFALAVVFMLAGGVALFAVAKYVDTSPSQCMSCHPQITELWQRSRVHVSGSVTCEECHAAHAETLPKPNLLVYYRDRLIPDGYMASAERVETRCQGCHTEVKDSNTEKSKVIRVNHKAHLSMPIEQEGRKITLGCLDCHANIAHDKAEEETNRPPMMTCFVASCHVKERNRDHCLKCHYQMLLEETKTAAK